MTVQNDPQIFHFPTSKILRWCSTSKLLASIMVGTFFIFFILIGILNPEDIKLYFYASLWETKTQKIWTEAD
jgi:hypothetical protein